MSGLFFEAVRACSTKDRLFGPALKVLLRSSGVRLTRKGSFWRMAVTESLIAWMLAAVTCAEIFL